ncbi:MAG TPA: porin [Polyangia bacterium]
MKIETPNGNSIRFGLLLQPQYQVLGFNARDGYSSDLFIHRTRLLVGGTVMGAFDYFLDTEFANIGIATATTGTDAMMVATSNARKTIPGMNLLDVFATWKSLGDEFKVDVGYMLPPLGHNAVQGATTLFGLDYNAYSFGLHNAPFSQNPAASATNPAANGVVPGTASTGRDVGVQLRGLVLGGMLEYRVGAFQGIRTANTPDDALSSNMPRFAARLQLNLMDAEPGFFYAGTYLGKKKIVSIGAAFDYQKALTSSSFDNAYHMFALDGFVDLPMGGGVLTVQENFNGWHGGTLIAGLPKWTNTIEAGFTFLDINLSPIVRYERAWGDFAAQDRYSGGLAFWPFGHNANVKLFYSRINIDNAALLHKGVNQVNAQLQLYFF